MTADKERNIAHARRAIEEAAEKGAQLVLLPVGFFNYALCHYIYWIHDSYTSTRKQSGEFFFRRFHGLYGGIEITLLKFGGSFSFVNFCGCIFGGLCGYFS